jgi:hypothetical protein
VAAEAAEAAPKNIRQVAERMSQWGPRLMNTAFQHIEEFMIAFSIALAGVIVGYVVYRLMTACLGTLPLIKLPSNALTRVFRYTRARPGRRSGPIPANAQLQDGRLGVASAQDH